MTNNFRMIVSTIAILFLIISCQGGGSGGSGDTSPPSEGGSNSVTLSLSFPENVQNQLETSHESIFSAQSNTINKVMVSARCGDKDLVKNRILAWEDGSYKTTISGIPDNGDIVFWVFAYDESGKETYAASKAFEKAGDAKGNVAMPMKKADTIPLPRIKSLVMDEVIKVSSETAINLKLEGPGFPIDFSFESQEGGGRLYSDSIKIIPDIEGAALMSVTYQAPENTGEFSHTIKYSNHNGTELFFHFKTNVVLNDSVQAPKSNHSPWIRSFGPKFRMADKLYWDVAVDVEGESTENPNNLTYDLSFEPRIQGENSNVRFVGEASEGPTLINYHDSVEGTVSFMATDSFGTVIESQYDLSPNKFPECQEDCDQATQGDEFQETVFVGQQTTLHLYDYISRWSWYTDFEWTVFSQPAEGALTISNPHNQDQIISPNVKGSYLIRLVASRLNSYNISWIVLNVVDQEFSKTTVRLERISDELYYATLLSRKANWNEQLQAITEIGVYCDGFSGLEGLNGYTPAMADGGTNTKLVSFIDPRDPLLTVGSNHDLFAFRCLSEPGISLGAESAISYATKTVTGTQYIDVATTIQGNQSRVKPIVKLEELEANVYRIVLLSKPIHKNVKLVGVNNLGMQCPPDISAFSGLLGVNDYNVNAIQFNQYQSISFTDVSPARKTAGEMLALFEFQCTGTPQFVGGNTISINYQGHSAITGGENIIFKGL